MSSDRVAHIAALDDALEKHLADLELAERAQAVAYEKHAEFLRLNALHEAEIKAAMKERSDAYYAAQNCEKAIRQLGYVVMGAPGTTSRLDGHPGNFRVPVNASAATESDDEPAVP